MDLGEASPVGSTRCAARGGVSPRVENLIVKKVIKVTYQNQESRQCFECFGIPMHANVLQFRIFYGYPYISRIRIVAT